MVIEIHVALVMRASIEQTIEVGLMGGDHQHIIWSIQIYLLYE